MSVAAVIDVGTNSVKLTVAQTSGRIQIMREDSRVTRLGKDVDRDGILSADSIDRTLSAVKEYSSIARALGAERIVCAGTSALRDAKNANDFTEAVNSQIGIKIEIIAGSREADLAFKAVAGDPMMKSGEGSVLVFDIGGGSTELVFGESSRVIGNTSLNIGAVRVTEKYLKFDPPNDTHYAAAFYNVKTEISSVVIEQNDSRIVYGVGGTATTLAALVLNTKDVHGKWVERDDLDVWVQRLKSVTAQGRKNIPLLNPDRADIIVGGGIILLALLDAAGCRQFRVSVRGMRYGLLLELLT